MRKLQILAAMAAATLSLQAASYFTIADSVRLKPSLLDGYTKQTVLMANDAYCDSWSIAFAYPEGLTVKLVAGIIPLDGMSIAYQDYSGEWQIYEPQLNVSAQYANVTVPAPVQYGYYDYYGNGTYQPYGTVKWDAGIHTMFSLNIYVDPTFRSGYLTIDAWFNSSPDARGAILSNVRSFRRCYMWVGYMKGDVGGDERIDVADVTLLIDYILGKVSFDEFQQAAADLNGDGTIDIDDVTQLNNKVLNG